MHLSTEDKQQLFAKHGKSATNTGSPECQIALFTERINYITGHLKVHKKDFSAELNLVKMVGKRRALLDYLVKNDIFRYRAIIKELDIRK